MSAAQKVGIVASWEYLQHRIPQNVHEHPRRLFPIYQQLNNPRLQEMSQMYKGRSALEDELTAVHSQLYLNQIRQYALSSNPFAYDKDTYLMEDSFYVAGLAAGGCITLAEALMSGEIACGFALVRPPGHHADVGSGRGFCIFNNVAVVARYLTQHYGLKKIFIFDFDAHHGNGTQEIFWDDPRTLFLSIHQENLFPFASGAASETGEDEGKGYTLNIPVSPTFGDAEYSYIVERIVQEAIRQFAPEIILVSAGFDGHVDESISGLCLSTDWFEHLARQLKVYSTEYGANRLLYVLEGGYNPTSLAASVIAGIRGMYAPAERLEVPYSERACDLLETKILPYWGSKWRF